MKNKNDNLYKYSTERPWSFIIVAVLYLIGAASFPSGIFHFIPGAEKDVELISIFISRAICVCIPVWLMFEIKIEKIFLPKSKIADALLIIPFFVVALNNIPFFSFASGELSFANDVTAKTIIFYILACFCGVALEEIVFRGLVFSTLLRKYKDKKYCVFFAVLISSALFGVTHIVNLLGGASIGSVVMQIGYSFLLGGMCAVALYLTGCINYSIVLHFIFNLGGLLSGYGMISGTIWTTPTIALTAIIAVIVSVYTIILLLKGKKRDLIFEKIDYSV